MIHISEEEKTKFIKTTDAAIRRFVTEVSHAAGVLIINTYGITNPKTKERIWDVIAKAEDDLCGCVKEDTLGKDGNAYFELTENLADVLSKEGEEE